MRDKIIPFVVKNMIDYNGSCNPKAVLGLVLKGNPDLKSQVPNVLKEIDSVISEFQGKSNEELKKELESLAPELLVSEKKEEVEGPLKALAGAEKGKLVVRIAPSPSGPLHIGHAYGSMLNFTYAKMYDGKFILRIEDTNPANIYSPAYEMIEDDVNWLTNNKIDSVVIQSERLEIYRKHITKLVEQSDAYVCTCDADEWREMKAKKEACPCRSEKSSMQLEKLAKMFKEHSEGGFAEGEAVLRLKTDIEHKNPAMRDFSIARIAEHIHPRTKSSNRVWPLMVLSVAIDDHELGVTHVLNGKDHHDNGLKEAIIMEKLGWKAPVYKHWGRINFEGFKLSTSKTRIAIEEGEYTGWDDIRLATLKALRRRGYKAEAFTKFAIEIGLSLTDKTVSKEEFWKMINAFNKEIVDSQANRFFFVDDPVEINIIGMDPCDVKLAVHADFEERGFRTLNLNSELLIAKSDFESLESGKVHRLIDCCNFVLDGSEFKFHSESFEEYKNAENRGKIIHFLPNDKEQLTQVDVKLEDNSHVTGFAEKSLAESAIGDLVQFERRYFARVDAKEEGKVSLWYLHK